MIRQPVDGRPELGEPVLSQCDVEALAFVFAWALKAANPSARRTTRQLLTRLTAWAAGVPGSLGRSVDLAQREM
jgi:hypothetical protein